jgi:hypothetical protein
MVKFSEILALGTSLFSDTVVELFGGIVPGVGDAFDALQIAINFILLRDPAVLVGAGEFIPIVGDILPCHTASAVWAILRKRRRG